MRRILFAAVLAVGTVLASPAVATANPLAGPPYVARAEWAKWGDLSSLRVYPTAAGQSASAQSGSQPAADAAWAEVLALAPDAAMAGMREQFDCHWWVAELAKPGKTSWNLEPWRPEVGTAEMAAAHCNPGGTEEPF